MSISSRLIIFLVLLVGVLNVGGGYVRLHQRSQILENAARSELRAHADTLRIALEGHFRNDSLQEVQKLIDKVSDDPRIRVDGVVIYTAKGEPAYFSHNLTRAQIKVPEALEKVKAEANPVYSSYTRNGKDELSLLEPIDLGKSENGAIEINLPTEFMNADIGAARDQIWQLTLIHWTLISIVVWLMLRYYLAYPIKELIKGAGAFSQGDLKHRVKVPRGSHEFARLADSFNKMAERLIAQREASDLAADEQRRLEQQLLTAERLAALGRLAAGVAHEMGAPLNVIKGRIEMLRTSSGLPPEKIERNLEIIDRQADAITHTVQQLLNLARPRTLSRRLVSWDTLVDSTLELIESDASSAGVALIRLPGPPVKLEVDPEWLGQVLTNLYRNAIQAMPDGGKLTIELLPEKAEREGQDFYAIRVLDTGMGIAREHVNKVFDPFFTTKDVGQGTGLGLSLSRRIVEEHGGWIAVANRPEGGAAFTIYLPAGVEAPAPQVQQLVTEEVS